MPDDLPRIPKCRGPRNKPRDDAWLQQQLAAFRPLYTFRCALPIVSTLAFLCIAISVAFYKSAMKTHEIVIDYTDCDQRDDLDFRHFYDLQNRLFCEVPLKLPEIVGEVLFFYGLRGFYQNVRKYQQSRNDRQLAGEVGETDECYPFTHDNKLPIVPCGAIANSMFNDTFRLTYNASKNREVLVPLTSGGLLHPSFRAQKYKNPKKCTENNSACFEGSETNCTARCPGFEHTAQPPSWTKPIAEFGDLDGGWGLENFDFIQWMETAALPNFRKLYRKLSQPAGSTFSSGLPAGEYKLRIEYNYPVRSFGARKLFVIQSDGPLGPKAQFQMCAYFAVGFALFGFSMFISVVEFAPSCTLRVRRWISYFDTPEISGL